MTERTSSILDDRGKRSKTLSEVKLVENKIKNLQSFLEVNPVQKEILPSNKLQDHTYEYYNPFGLKQDNLSQITSLVFFINTLNVLLNKHLYRNYAKTNTNRGVN